MVAFFNKSKKNGWPPLALVLPFMFYLLDYASSLVASLVEERLAQPPRSMRGGGAE